MKLMSFNARITVELGEGNQQSEFAVKDALRESLDEIGTLYVQDDDHEEETEYTVLIEELSDPG